MARGGRLQERTYQKNLTEEALRGNSLLVLPTGLGKTVIACRVIDAVLAKRGGRALVLAPSRPLVDQHQGTLSALLPYPVVSITGGEPPRTRGALWRTRRLLVATPQTAVNDAVQGLVPEDLSVVVFDEAHRAVGNYAYVEFGGWLRRHCPEALVLGLTASPGHELGHIEEVRANLDIEHVLLRTREDADVAPYVAPVSVEWIEVDPGELIPKVAGYLTKYLNERLNQLRKYGFLRDRKNTQVRIQDLSRTASQVAMRLKTSGRRPYLFQASRQLALARMAIHAAGTVQREGVDALLRFVTPKLGKGRTRTDASFVNDKRVARAIAAAKKWKGPSHPKIAPLQDLLRKDATPGRKVIVFAELRDTVDHLVALFRDEGLSAERFTGQGSRQGRKGMTQKQQRALLQRFAGGEFPILCATSIAEEGLDIPQVDVVVFFEPVASDIRLIQRSGRTGRDAPGRVVVLSTDRSLDEKYLWSGVKRERRMRRLVKRLAEGTVALQARKTKAAEAPSSPPRSPPPTPPPAGQSTLDVFA